MLAVVTDFSLLPLILCTGLPLILCTGLALTTIMINHYDLSVSDLGGFVLHIPLKTNFWNKKGKVNLCLFLPFFLPPPTPVPFSLLIC